MPDHLRCAVLYRPLAYCGAAFLVTDFLVQNLPDQPTKPMGNRPDSLIVSEARYQTAIDHLEDTSFGFHCRVSSLVENAPHGAVALGRPVAVVHSCTLVVSGAGTNPRGELLLGRKGRCCGTHFGNVSPLLPTRRSPFPSASFICRSLTFQIDCQELWGYG